MGALSAKSAAAEVWLLPKIPSIVRIFGQEVRKLKQSARSKGFIAKRAHLAQNPHKREDLS
jgi:hypothetical protein